MGTQSGSTNIQNLLLRRRIECQACGALTSVYAHSRRVPESNDVRLALRGGNPLLVRGFTLPSPPPAHPLDPVGFALCRLLLCGDDVQHSAAGGNQCPRGRHRTWRGAVRSLGRDDRRFPGAGHSGTAFRRWRNHGTGRQLLQYGGGGLPLRLGRLPPDCLSLGSDVTPPRSGVRSGRICGFERCRAARRHRTRHSAPSVSRCAGSATVCALSPAHCGPGHAHRPP